MPLQKVLIPAYVEVSDGADIDNALPTRPVHPDQGLPGYVHPDNSLPWAPVRPVAPIYLPGHPHVPLYPLGGPGHPSGLPIVPTLPIDPSWDIPANPPHGPGWWLPVRPDNDLPPTLGFLPVDPEWGLPVAPAHPDNDLPGHWVPIDPGFGNPICPSTPPARPKYWVFIFEVGPDYGLKPMPK